MIGSIAVIALAILIGIMKIPRLLKNHWYKEIAVLVILLAAGAGLSTLPMLLISIADPLYFLRIVYKPISDVFFNSMGTK